MTSTNPTQIIFNPTDAPVAKRLLIRNPTADYYVVKIVPSSKKYIGLSHDRFIIMAKNYVKVTVTVNTRQIPLLEQKTHALNVYARPFNVNNVASIKKWMDDDGAQTVKQHVLRLTVNVSRAFSARDTVIEVPGNAQAAESIQWSSALPARFALDKDTITAVGMDDDAKTCRAIDKADNMYAAKDTASLLTQLAEWLALPSVV